MDDELETQLRSLPQPVLDPAARARIHAQARAAFDAATPSKIDRWVSRFERLYARCEPILAVVVGVIHLSWAIGSL